MLDVTSQVVKMIYDGYNNPNLKTYSIGNLTTGNAYGFSVVAINFNGFGPASAT